MDINNDNQNQEIEQASEAPRPSKKPGNMILKVLGALIILVAVFYGLAQLKLGEKKPGDYSLQEIDNLQEDQQKNALEVQLKDYQEKAAALPADATVSDKYTVYIRLAEIQNRLGRYNEAIQSLEKIAEDNSGNARVHATYAVSYKGINEIGDARGEIQKALDIDDESAEYWQTFFEVNVGIDNTIMDGKYNTALKKTGNNLEIVKSYARFLEKVGNKEKAISYWETARNINADGAAEYDAEIARLRS